MSSIANRDRKWGKIDGIARTASKAKSSVQNKVREAGTKVKLFFQAEEEDEADDFGEEDDNEDNGGNDDDENGQNENGEDRKNAAQKHADENPSLTADDLVLLQRLQSRPMRDRASLTIVDSQNQIALDVHATKARAYAVKNSLAALNESIAKEDAQNVELRKNMMDFDQSVTAQYNGIRSRLDELGERVSNAIQRDAQISASLSDDEQALQRSWRRCQVVYSEVSMTYDLVESMVAKMKQFRKQVEQQQRRHRSIWAGVAFYLLARFITILFFLISMISRLVPSWISRRLVKNRERSSSSSQSSMLNNVHTAMLSNSNYNTNNNNNNSNNFNNSNNNNNSINVNSTTPSSTEATIWEGDDSISAEASSPRSPLFSFAATSGGIMQRWPSAPLLNRKR